MAYFECYLFITFLICSCDGIAGTEVGVKYQLGQFILKIFLDGSFQRTCAKLSVITFVGNKILGFIGEDECLPQLIHT